MKSLGKVLEYPLRFFESFPPSHLGNSNEFDCARFGVGWLIQHSTLTFNRRLATLTAALQLSPLRSNFHRTKGAFTANSQ
jgi:hypothetical protein